MQMERATEFNDLPEDIITLIFSFLDVRLVQQASAVCHHWARLTKDHSLWKTVDLRNKKHFGDKTWSEGQVMSIISKCMSLHTTDLIVECTLGSKTLRCLSTTCPNLTQLVLFACKLEGTSAHVGQLNFPKLNTLDWRMTCGFLAELAHLSVECGNIENLGLGQRLMGISSEQLFTTQPNLKIIDCHESDFITDLSVEILANSCPHLVSASFINCRNLQGHSLPTLMSACRNLKTLRMRGDTLRERPFQEIAWEETQIIELDFQDVPQITDTTLSTMLLALRRLRYLRCPVTDGTLARLRSGFPDLQVLKIRSATPISRDALALFLCACPNLEVLDISAEPVGAEQFAMFLPCLPNLMYINMAGDRDTVSSIDLLQQFCPLLKVLSIQFYRASNNSGLSTSLVEFIEMSPRLQKVLISGVDIEPTIDETRSALERRLGTRRVDVIADKWFEGMEVIPPMFSLDNILKDTFQEYQVISEKRLPGSMMTSVRRFLSQRRG